jgi:hypothetical protein
MRRVNDGPAGPCVLKSRAVDVTRIAVEVLRL